MADNTTLNPGVAGDIIRTEDVGAGVKIAVGKTHTGDAGVDGGPVTVSNPFPVMLASGSNVLGGQNPLAVSGSFGQVVSGAPVAATNPLPVQLWSGSLALGGSSNPLQVTGSITVIETSGSVVGLLVGGVAVAGTNPLPATGSVNTFSGINVNNKIRAIVPANSAAGVNILSASVNLNRTRATIFNHGNASLYLIFGSSAPTINNFDVKIASASYYELPDRPMWQDAVQGIWDATNGFAMINDYTGSF